MRNKIFERSLGLLMLVGSVLFVLWIVTGYGPERIIAENVRGNLEGLR